IESFHGDVGERYRRVYPAKDTEASKRVVDVVARVARVRGFPITQKQSGNSDVRCHMSAAIKHAESPATPDFDRVHLHFQRNIERKNGPAAIDENARAGL